MHLRVIRMDNMNGPRSSQRAKEKRVDVGEDLDDGFDGSLARVVEQVHEHVETLRGDCKA